MINQKSVIGIVPARSGSKGVPGKNVRELCGKPLMAWSIEAGLASKYIDVLIVSTDSEEIASIARNYGASTPFIRPPALATDEATSIDVIKHSLEYYSSNLGRSFFYTVLLEPTSPQRDFSDIDGALEALVNNSKAVSIVGISKTEAQNPAFLVKINDDLTLTGHLNSGLKLTRRQEIEDIYFLDGSIYISESAILIERMTFYHEETIGYLFPKWKSLEIDDEDDFIMVEALMAQKVMGK